MLSQGRGKEQLSLAQLLDKANESQVSFPLTFPLTFPLQTGDQAGVLAQDPQNPHRDGTSDDIQMRPIATPDTQNTLVQTLLEAAKFLRESAAIDIRLADLFAAAAAAAQATHANACLCAKNTMSTQN